jgi:putative transcriptional regulator
MSESVRNRVQRARQRANVTQEALGAAVGVTRQTIIAIERGNYTPSVLLAIKLARYFGMRVEELFTIDRS